MLSVASLGAYETELAAPCKRVPYVALNPMISPEAAITSEHLVPLPFAVRMVYLLAHGFGPPSEHFLYRLDGLAYSLAAACTLYVLDGPDLSLRPLRPE